MSHITVVKNYAKSQEKRINKQVDSINKAKVRTTKNVPHTVYFITKKDRPFSHRTDLLNCKNKMGLVLV